MSAIWFSLRRYTFWAAFGAALFAIPFLVLLQYNSFEALVPFLTITACVGGVLLVCVRTVVGVTTRSRSGAADRTTAVLIGRFFIGWVVGLAGALLYCMFGTWDVATMRLFDRGYWVLAFMLSGAISMVLTAWLANQRYGRVLLPVSWLVIFAVLLNGWYALYQQYSREFNRFFG